MIHPSGPDFRLYSDLHLAAVPTAVGCAQLFVKYTLGSWRLDELTEPVSQIVTELVTRAVFTTGIADHDPRWAELDELKLITVRLLVIEQLFVVEVADADPAFGGDGEKPLVVVPSLCKRWSYYAPKVGGKVIWGELLLDSSAPSGFDQTLEIVRPLPRRVPRREPADPIEAMDDIGVLRRVRDSLRSLGGHSVGGDEMR
jgi:hypothetical protein